MAGGAIVDLRRERLAALRSLLRENGLPDDDCDNPSLCFCGIFEGDDLVAAGGLEPVPPYALLRSVAVRQDRRGRGLAAPHVAPSPAAKPGRTPNRRALAWPKKR